MRECDGIVRATRTSVIEFGVMFSSPAVILLIAEAFGVTQEAAHDRLEHSGKSSSIKRTVVVELPARSFPAGELLCSSFEIVDAAS